MTGCDWLGAVEEIGMMATVRDCNSMCDGDGASAGSGDLMGRDADAVLLIR